LYVRGWLEGSGNAQVGLNFHFSVPPAVTAGFIGFSFDIRELHK
jgi:hypothetical protein